MTKFSPTLPGGGGEVFPEHEPNLKWWDEVTPVHVASRMYDVPAFLEGKTALDRLELEWLGDVRGKSVLHLQCHFGKSTIEIARQGAAKVVGVDFSPVAIKEARKLAELSGVADRVEFIESDVLKLNEVHVEKHDIVFTSWGVITWLSDLNRWGEVISKLLKPDGRFVIVEIHPVFMMYELEEGNIARKFGYFHCEEGVELPPAPDYADKSYVTVNATHEWQWSLADVFRALMNHNLRITKFEEYPLCCFDPFGIMVPSGEHLYMLPPGEPEIPMSFAVEALRQ
ncbi:class I SAM-dependent methyltransferase [bacterium]|nr:class I SAM-dependent methyltransferase [bacterium]